MCVSGTQSGINGMSIISDWPGDTITGNLPAETGGVHPSASR